MFLACTKNDLNTNGPQLKIYFFLLEKIPQELLLNENPREESSDVFPGIPYCERLLNLMLYVLH